MPDIYLYNFSKRINSTKRPAIADGLKVSVALKQPTNEYAPHFILDSVSSFNYNYVSWGNRYYFIEDVIVLSNTRDELICKLDALATFKTDIGSLTTFVERAASSHDGNLVDSLMPAKSSMDVQSVNIPAAFTAPRNLSGNNLILSVVGENANIPAMLGMTHYAMGHNTFKYVQSTLYADNDFLGIFQSSQNPLQYVTGARIYPFNILPAGTVGVDAIVLGNWTVPGYLSNAITTSVWSDTSSVTLPSHPQAATYPWTNHNPYSKFTIHYPPFGDIPLDGDAIMNASNRNVTFSINVDLLSGMGMLTVSNGDGDVLARLTTKVGVDEPISQITRATVGDFVSSITGAVATGAMIGSGNVVGGIATGISSIASTIESQMPTLTRVGGQGSLACYEKAPTITCEFTRVATPDNANMGRPLCSTVTLSTLSGYIKCSGASVSANTGSAEIEEINQYLNQGFYYE